MMGRVGVWFGRRLVGLGCNLLCVGGMLVSRGVVLLRPGGGMLVCGFVGCVCWCSEVFVGCWCLVCVCWMVGIVFCCGVVFRSGVGVWWRMVCGVRLVSVFFDLRVWVCRGGV